MVSPPGFWSVNGKKRPIAPSRRGMALVIVLSSLVLLSILVVSILTSARQEVTSSNSYGAGSDAKLLADLPVNLELGRGRPTTEAFLPTTPKQLGRGASMRGLKRLRSLSLCGSQDGGL